MLHLGGYQNLGQMQCWMCRVHITKTKKQREREREMFVEMTIIAKQMKKIQ